MTWPTRIDGSAGALSEADEFAGRSAHLSNRAGRGLNGLRPHGLDRVDDEKTRRRALRKRRHDILDRGLGGDFDGGIGETEPFGAQPNLRHGFLAGDVDGAVSLLREGGRDLDQQRRFADAGIAAEQQHRAAHKSAAGHAVEFGDAGAEARRLVRFTLERFDGEQPALARRARLCAAAFLDKRIPGSASVAAAGPARGRGAAILANKILCARNHRKNRVRPAAQAPR